MEPEADIVEVRPNAGKQEAFLASPADISIYGGGAGGGKTWALLLDQARWAMRVKGFTGVIFRRTYPEIMNPGALWDESMRLLPLLGGVPTRSESKWTWPETGSWIKFSHLQHDDDVHSWQGAQLTAIAFDEMTHFSESQFWYLLSRLRSRCGVRPYFRGTCNPDPTSWVAEFLKPWIGEAGVALPDAHLKIKYMARSGGRLDFADTKEALTDDPLVRPLSVAFIPALVEDNPVLLKDDPDYLSKLQALTTVDRARLRDGNWKIRAGGGSFFKREWIAGKMLAERPEGIQWVRYWDRAATEPSESNKNPDWTRGALVGLDGHRVILADISSVRSTPGTTQNFIKATAQMDGLEVEQVMEQDPGQAGVVDIAELVKLLAGYPIRKALPQGHKADRFKPFSSQAEAGNVYLVEGAWVEGWIQEAEAFLDNREVKEPSDYHDDQIDATGGGYNFLCANPRPRIRQL